MFRVHIERIVEETTDKRFEYLEDKVKRHSKNQDEQINYLQDKINLLVERLDKLEAGFFDTRLDFLQKRVEKLEAGGPSVQVLPNTQISVEANKCSAKDFEKIVGSVLRELSLSTRT